MVTYTLGDRVVCPDPARGPVRDTVNMPHGIVEFPCGSCGEHVSLDLSTFNDDYGTPEEVLDPDLGPMVREHFELRVDRQLLEGWPKLRVEAWRACGAEYLVCVIEDEPHNGWHQWTLRGITALMRQGSSTDSRERRL
jgi:hypothetical protein